MKAGRDKREVKINARFGSDEVSHVKISDALVSQEHSNRASGQRDNRRMHLFPLFGQGFIAQHKHSALASAAQREQPRQEDESENLGHTSPVPMHFLVSATSRLDLEK